MKKRLLPIISILLITAFSGCSMMNPEDYMRAPKAQGVYAEAETALKRAVGNDIILKFPRMGEELSAFVTVCDEKDKEEIVAFYTKPSDENPVIHLNLLRHNSESWVSSDDFETSITDIELISVQNFKSKDENPELLVHYISPLSFTEGLAVVSVEDGKINFEASVSCTDYFTIDSDRNGDSELFTISLDTVKRESVATLYDFTDDGITVLSQTNLDGTVSAYESIKLQQTEDDWDLLFVDGVKNAETLDGSRSVITEIIYFDGNNIRAPFTDNEEKINSATFRNVYLPSEDFDNDGVLEIPLINYVQGDSGEYITYFSEFERKTESLKTEAMVYTNNADNYYIELDLLNIPLKPKIEKSEGKVVFSDKKGVIFTVLVTPSDEYEKQNGYELLEITENKVYTVKIEKDITFSELKKAFFVRIN